MDPASIIGVVAASAQFADTARKLAKIVKEIHAGTNAGTTKRRLVQLETWAEVAEKIRDSGDQNDPQTEKIMKQCLPTVQALADQLGRIQINEADGRRGKTRKALLARWEKDDIAELFAQLHRDQMTLLTYRNFAFEGHFLDKIRESMGSVMDERLRYSEQDEQSAFRERVLGAIFITDPRDDRNALIQRKASRVEGTCAWITKTAEFVDWMSSTAPSPGLIVEGGPGKGKSMIAIYLTEYLEQLAKTSEAKMESVIYFFCDNRNPTQNNALAVIRCLVWQLCQLRPQLLDHVVKEAKARGDAKRLVEQSDTAVETLWRIFINMINDEQAGTVSCVVDGLDECDEFSILSILTKFHGLMARHETPRLKLKFIILSRPLTSRCRPPALRTLPIPKINLDPDLNKDDITVFIEKRIDELAESSDRLWRNSLRRKVKETLLKKAGGTFLWVGFVADNLRGKSAFEVNSCLRSLPLGLHDIYDRILLGMPAIHRFKIRSILHWICLAHHPLCKTELIDLVHEEKDIDDDGASHADSCAMSDSDRECTPDTDLGPDMDELEGLLEYCKPIIRISYNDTVHFVHQSVKDYLMRTDRIDDTDLEYFMVGNLKHKHEELGLRCIEIILEHHRDVKSNRIAGDDKNYWMLSSPCERYTSLGYASIYWVHHIRSSGTEYRYSTTTDKVLQMIDDEDEVREAWYCEYARSIGDRWGFFKSACIGTGRITTLNLAITLGLGTTVRQLLLSMSIDDYIRAMRLDSLRGSEWFRSQPDGRLWLEKKGGVRGQFLRLAIKNHHRHIVRVILDRYGSNAVFSEQGSLSTAVGEGDRETVQLLLALRPSPREVHGKDLDKGLAETAPRLGRYDDGIPLAVELINAGADPREGCGLSLLGLLARRKWSEAEFELAQLLLKSGLDIGQTGLDDGWTPLHHAASATNVSMASLLLEWAAPVDAVDSKLRTPLHIAAMAGHGALVGNMLALLITAGRASASQGCPDGETPGVCWDIDRQDSDGRSALHFASQSAAPEAVEVLLQAGADSRLKDDEGKTPFGILFNSDDTPFPKMDLEDHDRRITCIHLLRNKHGG